MIRRSLPRMKKVVRISSRPPSALAPSTVTARSGAKLVNHGEAPALPTALPRTGLSGVPFTNLAGSKYQHRPLGLHWASVRASPRRFYLGAADSTLWAFPPLRKYL